MDELAYRAARCAVNASPCVFEKVLLMRCTVCELASRHALAEREAVACTSAIARMNCAMLVELLRERATFALKLAPSSQSIAHAAMMKLQCGGLAGLQHALEVREPDVHRLVVQAQARWGSLVDLPWLQIVRAVVQWQGRRRRPATGGA